MRLSVIRQTGLRFEAWNEIENGKKEDQHPFCGKHVTDFGKHESHSVCSINPSMNRRV
jgi:hypothetical protein